MRAHLASLVEDFRKHAAETAVVAHRGVRRYATTYGEVAEIVGRFAAELERREVRPGERVVLWGADSAEWIGVFFGCVLRGVMVVPLDAAGDAGFAERVIRDVGARLVVGDSHLLRKLESAEESCQLSVVSSQGERVPGAKAPMEDGAVLPGGPTAKALGYQSRPISEAMATATTEATAEPTATTKGNPPFHDEAVKGWATQMVTGVAGVGVSTMELGGIGARLGGEPLWAVSEAVGLDTPFQIVFTSGTTREPRGVVHTHRNVLATLDPIEREIQKYRRLERVFHPLRFLHSLPLSHVFGQFMGLWCPALLAAEVHFAEQLEPARMVELIRRERISVLVAVPRVLELLRGHLLARFEGSCQLSVVSSQKRQERITEITEEKREHREGGGESCQLSVVSSQEGQERVPGAKAPVEIGAGMPGLKSRPISETRADGSETRADGSETRADGSETRAGGSEARAGGAKLGAGELRTENLQLTTVVKKCWRGRRVHGALGWKFWAVISGGATLPRELEEFWSGLGFALIQGYGMTETTALVTLNHPFHIKQGTIGKTLPGREVKIGADGEILVRGDVVAGATWEGGAMRRREGEWLATGDLAEAGAEGELKFVGRKGDVIVTGAGMNVHPADLEGALAGQAGVRGCVVVGCDFAAGMEAVAVVLFAGTEAELAAAVGEANRGLAEYQQIRRWVRWPELKFPYTSTGKVVRREVARRVCGRSSQLSVVSSQERRGDGLLAVIEEVTREAVRGDGDVDGLRLGEDLKLDSLGRVQLQSALEQRFDVELDEDAMAAVATVGELRRMVEGASGKWSAVSGEKEQGQMRGFLGQAQDRLLHSASLTPASKLAGDPDSGSGRDDGGLMDGGPGRDDGSPRSAGGEGSVVTEARGNPPFHGGAVKGWATRFAEGAGSGRRGAVGEEMVYPRWAWWWWVRWIRVAWIEAVMRPLVWLLARPKVRFVTKEGANAGVRAEYVTCGGTNTGILRYAQNDKLNGGRNDGGLEGGSGRNDELDCEGPVLVVANHVTSFDGALVLYALPGRVRRRVACAMSGEMLMDYRRGRGQGNWVLNVLAPGAWLLLTALFNVFPLPRARGFRRSFAHAGEAMDRGYSVLVFPEGSRSRDGTMHGFRGGIGLLAKEAGAAVIPVGLRGLYELAGEKRGRWFHAGKIEIRVGAVVETDEASDPAEVTGRLEAAVRGLVVSG